MSQHAVEGGSMFENRPETNGIKMTVNEWINSGLLTIEESLHLRALRRICKERKIELDKLLNNSRNKQLLELKDFLFSSTSVDLKEDW